MSALFTMFLAQFVAPIPIAMGIAGGFVSRSWWHVLITAVLAATVSEYFLGMADPDHRFTLTYYIVGIIAAGLWAAWFYWLRLARQQHK